MAPMEEFIEMLKSHNRIVFFGGAGVSTESDICLLYTSPSPRDRG